MSRINLLTHVLHDRYGFTLEGNPGVLLQPFMALFVPDAHREVDWDRGHEVLDKELQQITREAVKGRPTVDNLMKVWLRDGKETWILVYVKVQAH